ncbi:MAG: hypothetical protein Q9M26_07635 [Mariprofundales bacterium]|nr:hypothetical protein [Mariprofundales bacterium]
MSITLMLVVGIISIVGISVSDVWAVKAMGAGIMGMLLVYTVQSFVRDYMDKREPA